MSIQLTDVDYSMKQTASALAPVSGYEPWPMRSMESVKETLAKGVPVLMRVHCAADYPTGSETDDHKLDMESHAVLLVGYDDCRKAFLIVDPWRSELGGSCGGERYLSYEDYCLLMVNGTAEKATVLSLPQIKMNPRCSNGERFIDFRVGFFRPRGYVLDEASTFFSKLSLLIAVGNTEVARELEGKWCIGEYARFSIPVPNDVVGVAVIQVACKITLEGMRPYKYKDELSYRVEQKIDFGRWKNSEVVYGIREVTVSA